MTDPFPHLRAAIQAVPWAITPERLLAVMEVVERRCAGIRLSQEEIAAIKGTRQPNGVISALVPVEHDPLLAALSVAGRTGGQPLPQQRMIAVIPIRGIIAQRASSVDDVSGPGGTSTERVSKALAEAVDNPAVSHVVLDIDSGGGTVQGTPELAEQIFKARDRKPIIAQVASAGSAAYWLASQASHIAVQPSGEVGSIGVFAVHTDVSKAAESEGVKFTYISAGKHKIEANPHMPLSETAAAHLQETVDSFYGDFVEHVARGRARMAEQVIRGFGEGRMVRAAAAVRMGMADSIATLDETLRRLAAGKSLTRSNARADDMVPEMAAAMEQQTATLTHELNGLSAALASIKGGLTPAAQQQPAFSFAEAIAAAENNTQAIVETELSKLRASMDDIVAKLQAIQEPKAVEPAALTSPLMQKCETCGCNMEASQAATGMGEGDMPTREHPQSSMMEKCPQCGKMREPPAARDGSDGGAGAAKPEPDPQAVIAAEQFRRRRHAARMRRLDAMRG